MLRLVPFIHSLGRRLDAARTREVVDAAVEAGVTFFDTAPPGSRLEGADGDRVGDERLVRVEALEAFTAGRGHTLLELAVSGLASVPGIASVIVGATSAGQVRANVAAGAWQR